MTEVILPDFDYMQREARQHSLLSETTVAVEPTAMKFERQKKVEFEIPESEHFTSLHDTTLKVVCKITKKGGTACDHAAATSPDKVMPINNVFHSMWSSVSVYLNGHLAEFADNYGYKAYLTTLMSMDKSVMEQRGKLVGWSKDTAGQMEVAASDGANLGGRARGATFATSQSVTMIGHLLSDIFMQGCSIPPHTSIKVVLQPAPETFALMAASGSEYELHIQSAEMHVVRQQTPPPLVHAVTSLTSKRDLKLYYRRTEVTMRNLDGAMKETVDLFGTTAPLPDRILLGFVTCKAYAGQSECNPFNFQKFDYTSLHLVVDGKNYPSLPYAPDFGNRNDYYPLYNSLLREFNSDKGNSMINVTPDEFANGYTLYPFRLTPRSCCGDVLGDPLTGGIKLMLIKKTESSETLTVIVLAEYRSEYAIAQVGAVASDPKPQQ